MKPCVDCLPIPTTTRKIDWRPWYVRFGEWLREHIRISAGPAAAFQTSRYQPEYTPFMEKGGTPALFTRCAFYQRLTPDGCVIDTETAAIAFGAAGLILMVSMK